MGLKGNTYQMLSWLQNGKHNGLLAICQLDSLHPSGQVLTRKLRGLWKNKRFYPPTNMEFFKKFTPPDFQAKNCTPSISPNFNSFSGKKHKKWVKMEKFTQLAKKLHCRRQWRQWQISPLLVGSFLSSGAILGQWVWCGPEPFYLLVSDKQYLFRSKGQLC